jgi:RNA polymerase sigma factor (sigma-70 family)
MSDAEAEQYDQFKAVFRAWYSLLCNYAVTFTKDPDVSEDIVQDLFVKIWEQRRELLTETSIRYYLFTAVRNNCITWLRREKQQVIIPFSDDQASDLAADEQYPGEGYPGENRFWGSAPGTGGPGKGSGGSSSGAGKAGGLSGPGNAGGSRDAGGAGREGPGADAGGTLNAGGAGGERDEMSLLQEGIDRLPPKCREIFLLSRFSKLSYKEIATSLDISPKTVENQLSKALRLLRAFLKANGVGLVLILALILP